LKDKEMDKVLLAEDLIKKNNMNRAMVDNASKAIGPCFDFIVGMIQFCHNSIEIVDPKKKEAAKAKIEKTEADRKLQEANEKLAKAEKESNELERRLKQKQMEKNTLIVTLNDNQTKVKRAKQLVELLSSEKMRWKENVKKLQEYSSYIVGDCLIAAAAIAYNGPFIAKYRSDLEANWREKLSEQNIIHTDNVSLRSVLEDKILTGRWNKAMLPNDNLSIENGIIMSRISFNTPVHLPAKPFSTPISTIEALLLSKLNVLYSVLFIQPEIINIIVNKIIFFIYISFFIFYI
jgi:hypothetical protein